MSIVVSSTVGCDLIVLHIRGSDIVLNTEEAYKLHHHLKHTLEQLIADQIAKERREFIAGAYSDY